MATLFSPCFLIPCFNHGAMLPQVVEKLAMQYAYPIIIVDDGSALATQQIINSLQEKHTVVTLPINLGKGGAVMAGIKKAAQLGYSHAIQIDADGQHDLSSLTALINEAQSHPQALISGRPVYDESVPKGRLYGRYLTHFWVWIETLSLSIKDSMCGFRVYPVATTAHLIQHSKIGLRMDFDIEIMVKLYWADCDVRFIDTRVFYPENGISHFDGLQDNIKISVMHTKLFFAMLPRIPALLTRKKRMQQKGTEKDNKLETNTHWSKQREQGTYLGIKFLLACYSLLGRTFFNIALVPVLFYYALTNKKLKRSSTQYFEQLGLHCKRLHRKPITNLSVYRHIHSFALTMLDKLAAWKGDINLDHLTISGEHHLDNIRRTKKGIIILGSHLGNLELTRALSRRQHGIKVNALVFTEHAPRFNAILKAINPSSDLNIIQVNRVGPDTAILLDQKIEAGEWVVIVGDRTSTSVESRVVWADFLGKKAPFPQGPFLLASVLKAPVYTLFALRDEHRKEPHYHLYFKPFMSQITLPREQREEALQSVAQQYASRLEHYTLKAPLQWYNFFNFWQLSGKENDK